MTRNRAHSFPTGPMATLRSTRRLLAALVTCLVALAVASLGASAAMRVESPGASQSAVRHGTKTKKKTRRAKKGKKPVACTTTKSKKGAKGRTTTKGKKGARGKTGTKGKPGPKHATCAKPAKRGSKGKPKSGKGGQRKTTVTPPVGKKTNRTPPPPPPPPLPTGPSPAGFNREIYGYTSTLTPQQEAQRYNVMVVQGTDAGMVPILKAANPHLKVFVYVDILRAVIGGTQSCTQESTDVSQHPNWLLTGTNGQPIIANNVYHLDIGNPAYQQACADGAIAQARSGDFDGVYFDGVDAAPAYGFGAGPVPVIPEYNRLPPWQNAITALLQLMVPQIHAAGYKVIGNIGGETPALFTEWEGIMDGAEDESFTDDTGGTAQWLYWWPDELYDMAWSEAHGKILLVHSHNLTEAGNTYGLATMMLAANGNTSYSTANGGYGGYEQWYPEYDQAEALGAPLGQASRLANGVWERKFVHGIVLVNPSTNTIGGIALGGTYSGSELANVSTVTMGPTTGLILLAG